MFHRRVYFLCVKEKYVTDWGGKTGRLNGETLGRQDGWMVDKRMHVKEEGNHAHVCAHTHILDSTH